MVNNPIFKFLTILLFIPMSVVITALSGVLFILAFLRTLTEKVESNGREKIPNIKSGRIKKSTSRILGDELYAGLN